MTRFCLIVATMGRVAELRALFDSLLAQEWPALDVILVDQNPDDRLAAVATEYAPRLPLRHIRVPRPHANAARNLGLRAAILKDQQNFNGVATLPVLCSGSTH